MSISFINKISLVLLCLVSLNACNSTKSIYENLNTTKHNKLVIEDLDDQKIILNPLDPIKINYENKITLDKLINKTQYKRDIIIRDKTVFALSKKNNILEFELNTGVLNSTILINIPNISNETVVSFSYLDDSFIIALKSGSILKIDLNGDLIWTFNSNKILNTSLSIFDDQIIALYIDEIKNISSKDGSLIWSQSYSGLPVYQAKGGQLVNFLNLMFFILPNNKVGSIDLNFGSEHNFVFNEMPLISSINNTKDEIHTFDNYFSYLDEGKYLYTVDVLINEYILFKKDIKSSSSNIFFNNALIVKEGNYLHAINIDNGKSFWLIENKDISVKSSIITVRSINENIEIYLNNGDILVIDNNELIEIIKLDVKNIKSIVFEKSNLIINTDNGKTIIY